MDTFSEYQVLCVCQSVCGEAEVQLSRNRNSRTVLPVMHVLSDTVPRLYVSY